MTESVGCLHKHTRPTKEAGHWGDICNDCGQVAHWVVVPDYSKPKRPAPSTTEFFAGLK